MTINAIKELCQNLGPEMPPLGHLTTLNLELFFQKLCNKSNLKLNRKVLINSFLSCMLEYKDFFNEIYFTEAEDEADFEFENINVSAAIFYNVEDIGKLILNEIKDKISPLQLLKYASINDESVPNEYFLTQLIKMGKKFVDYNGDTLKESQHYLAELMATTENIDLTHEMKKIYIMNTLKYRMQQLNKREDKASIHTCFVPKGSKYEFGEIA